MLLPVDFYSLVVSFVVGLIGLFAVCWKYAKLKVQKVIEIEDVDPVIVETLVRDFQYWKYWSPWFILDPEAEIEIVQAGSTTTPGVSGGGEKLTWKGRRIGSGALREVYANTDGPVSVEFAVETFTPFSMDYLYRFAFIPLGETSTGGRHGTKSGTKVIWFMEGRMPFYLAFLHALVSAVFGLDFDRGLKLLKDAAVSCSRSPAGKQLVVAASSRARTTQQLRRPPSGPSSDKGNKGDDSGIVLPETKSSPPTTAGSLSTSMPMPLLTPTIPCKISDACYEAYPGGKCLVGVELQCYLPDIGDALNLLIPKVERKISEVLSIPGTTPTLAYPSHATLYEKTDLASGKIRCVVGVFLKDQVAGVKKVQEYIDAPANKDPGGATASTMSSSSRNYKSSRTAKPQMQRVKLDTAEQIEEEGYVCPPTSEGHVLLKDKLRPVAPRSILAAFDTDLLVLRQLPFFEKCMSMTHLGPYRHLGNAWSRAHAMARVGEFTMARKFPCWEEYCTDPRKSDKNLKEEEIKTVLYFPLAS
ncbi:unnamed protein product [Amoebophrya sp. A120]|nr:unnamed protein product [Amoebophrya sp. A120]|eukprot:GSA120T00001290001.1